MRAELAALDTEVLAAEAELTARGDTDVSDELVRVEQLRERARGLAAVIVERRRSLERDRGQLLDAGVVANLEADAARCATSSPVSSTSSPAVGPEAEQLDRRRGGVRRTPTDDARDASATSPRRTSAASAAAEVRGELRSMHNGLSSATRPRPQRLESGATRCGRTTDRLDAEIERLQGALRSGATTSEAPLVAEVEQPRPVAWRPRQRPTPRRTARQRAAEELSRWRAGSRRCSWRSKRHAPRPAPSTSPASTACSARCST